MSCSGVARAGSITVGPVGARGLAATRRLTSRPSRATVCLLACVALCSLVLSACNTFHGMGKDIEYTGERLEQAVKP